MLPPAGRAAGRQTRAGRRRRSARAAAAASPPQGLHAPLYFAVDSLHAVPPPPRLLRQLPPLDCIRLAPVPLYQHLPLQRLRLLRQTKSGGGRGQSPCGRAGRGDLRGGAACEAGAAGGGSAGRTTSPRSASFSASRYHLLRASLTTRLSFMGLGSRPSGVNTTCSAAAAAAGCVEPEAPPAPARTRANPCQNRGSTHEEAFGGGRRPLREPGPALTLRAHLRRDRTARAGGRGWDNPWAAIRCSGVMNSCREGCRCKPSRCHKHSSL